MPAQRMQMKMPKFQDAHLGPGGERKAAFKHFFKGGGKKCDVGSLTGKVEKKTDSF